MELRPIEGRENQFERDVEQLEHFNGANCLVIVDVTRLGNKEALKRAVAGQKPPTVDELGDLIEAEIRQKIQACPAGENAKVQLMYHSDPKPLPNARGKPIQWQQSASIKVALQNFQANPEPRFTKLFLAGCNSHTHDLDLVSEAFQIPSIIHVVTFGNIIYLTPGKASGATYPDMHPAPLPIFVWEKDSQGREIAKKPSEPIDEDEELDLDTLYVEKKGSTATNRCPTQHSISGSGTAKAGTYASKTAASNAIIQLSSAFIPFAYSYAYRDATGVEESFSCPNASCQTTALSAVRVTNSTYHIRTSLLRSLGSFLGLANRWLLEVEYSWTATVSCY